MNKVKVIADLEIKSKGDTITVKSNDNNIFVDISSSSAIAFPLKTYLKFKKYISASNLLAQNVEILIGEEKIISIYNGQIQYHQKWWLFKFALRSLFR